MAKEKDKVGLKESYKFCDTDDTYITLHDCYANNISIAEDKLSFYFENGFWVAPDNKHSELDKTVRTDSSQVDFCFEKENSEEIRIYVFRKTVFGRTIRMQWELPKFIELINNKTLRLEFLYQYKGHNEQLYECWLHFDKSPYYYECLLKLPATRVKYYWNNLCPNKTW